LPDDTLHITDLATLLRGCDRDGSARLSGSTCSADSVNVVVGIVRNVEVHNEFDSLYIDTASCDVGGDENSVLASFEAVQRLTSLSE
jgi:hypothetical protein